MPLVHSFAPDTTQCRGCPNAAIDPNFPPPFQSFGNNAGDVIFPSADASFTAAATEKPAADVAGDSGAGEDGGHRSSMGPIPDIVPIAAVPSNNTTSSSAEGFPLQRLEEQQQLHHHHHYETENNHYSSYNASHHPSSADPGMPSSGADEDMVTGDQRGKEHLPNLAGEKENLEENGRTHRIVR